MSAHPLIDTAALDGVDTVAVAVPDLSGRLIGKRLSRASWESVRQNGEMAMPDFHLVTGPDNTPLPALEATGAHTGFRNGRLRPDLDSLRLLPWDPGTGLVLCDAHGPDGAAAEVSPRWILRRQLERLEEMGLAASCASELEFHVYRTSYEQAFNTGYRDLAPIYHRHGDNDLLVDGHVEGLLGEVRRLMPLAGVPVELSQGEGGVGQFEVTLAHSAPLQMADRHVVYKHGVKQLAQRRGLAATFMAKVAEDGAGSSCHVHVSLRGRDGRSALDAGPGRLTQLGRSFLAGLLEHAPALCLMHAPHANSYRRLQPHSWAPSNLTWGWDNRTCLVRVCGEGAARRFEFRLPGADANPYLVFAAVLAAGLAGLRDGLQPPAPVTGDAYGAGAARVPADIADAVAWFSASGVARDALGDAVHSHLRTLGEDERDSCRRQVTDRDRARCFEIA